MKKKLILFLIIFTLVFFIVNKYLLITTCNTYELKLINKKLYIKYGLLTEERLPNKLIGSLHACQRYKLLPLNFEQKKKLDINSTLIKIENEYYLEVPIKELFSNRDITLILKKISTELGGKNEN